MKILAYDPFISKERADQLGCTLVDLELLFADVEKYLKTVRRQEIG